MGVRGFGLPREELRKTATVLFDDYEEEIKTGHVAIAAITSCTNTSNPYVLMAAGLVAKRAVEKGLRVSKTVKTSLAPGSKVVTAYLKESGLQVYLDKLGFNVVGYGGTTCIGNSGNLLPEVAKAITDTDLLASAVLSGNRNFEGRINPLVKANFLASPPLVVAYALAGNANIDLTSAPLGYDRNGLPVYFMDLMPNHDLVADYVQKYVTSSLFKKEYEHVFTDSEKWNQISTTKSKIYHWNQASTYIQNPPYFDGLEDDTNIQTLKNLAVLAKFGDTITTDHISPAGNIARNSPAASYLEEHSVSYQDFNSYGSRRGNHEVMMRGTFANIRIKNELAAGKLGGYTKYKGELMPIYEAAMCYKKEKVDTIILAGRDCMGSSRDWSAKGANLLGVKVVLAESFERIHRSNLVMMGILPLQYLDGENAQNIGLTGKEIFDIQLPKEPQVGQVITVIAKEGDRITRFKARLRFDADADIRYYENGGILPMVVRKKLQEVKQ